jgi:hypothetical protein
MDCALKSSPRTDSLEVAFRFAFAIVVSFFFFVLFLDVIAIIATVPIVAIIAKSITFVHRGFVTPRLAV